MSTKIQEETALDFVSKLSDITIGSHEPNFDLLTGDSREKLDGKAEEIREFMITNKSIGLTDTEKTELFTTVVAKWNELRELVKTAVCTVNLTGVEQKILDSKLRQSVEYNSETIFYGIHIKKYILETLNRDNFAKTATQPIEISFSHSIIIHNLLSTVTVKGLNPDTFAFGHLVYNLGEVIKLYSHYNDLTQRVNAEMAQWNMGLDAEITEQLETLVSEQVAQEEG